METFSYCASFRRKQVPGLDVASTPFRTKGLTSMKQSFINIPMECRYQLATEFMEAVDHASDRGTNSKALLCMAAPVEAAGMEDI